MPLSKTVGPHTVWKLPQLFYLELHEEPLFPLASTSRIDPPSPHQGLPLTTQLQTLPSVVLA